MDTRLIAAALHDVLALTRKPQWRPKDMAAWSAAGPSGNRREWAPLIERENWGKLEALARKDLARYRKALSETRASLERIRAAQDRRAALVPFVDRLKLTPLQDPRLVKAVGAALRKKKGWSAARVREALAARGQVRPARTLQQAQAALALRVDTLDRVAADNTRAAAGALLVIAAARFNRAEARSDASLTAFLRGRSLELAESWELLASLLREDSAALPLAAANLSRVAARSLAALLPRLAAQAQAEEGRPQRTQTPGHAAADLARSCLLAQVTALRLWWLSAAPVDHPVRKAWRTPPQVPAFRNEPADLTAIASLALGAAALDGKPVTVEGRVGPVKIVHKGKKVISSTTLRDAGGKEIVAVLPYIKLDSGGLVPGATARIRGTWFSKSKETGGPALQLGRRSRRSDASLSLEDWAGDLLRPMFQVVAHGLDARWSWVRGVDGPANPIRYGVWFEE